MHMTQRLLYGMWGIDCVFSLYILLFAYFCMPEWFIQWCSSEFCFMQSPPPTLPNATSVRFLLICCSFINELFVRKTPCSQNRHVFIVYSKLLYNFNDLPTNNFRWNKSVVKPEPLLTPDVNPSFNFQTIKPIFTEVANHKKSKSAPSPKPSHSK